MTLTRDYIGGNHSWRLACSDCGTALPEWALLSDLVRRAEDAGWQLERLPGSGLLAMLGRHLCPGCRGKEQTT